MKVDWDYITYTTFGVAVAQMMTQGWVPVLIWFCVALAIDAAWNWWVAR